MENNFLPHFINETVYVIKEDMPTKKSNLQASDLKGDKTEEVVLPKEAESEITTVEPLKFKGSNARRTLIIVNYADHEHIHPADEEFLTKILKAVNIEIAEAAILNLSLNVHFDYEGLLTFEATHVLYFGENKILPNQFDYYSIKSEGNKQILLSPDLSKTAQDTEKKKQLWGALKKMF
ncbi:MAG: hypothetical protein AAFN93_22290 [Bacteroidota bacterium]